MHRIESISEGRIIGWASGDTSGCPAAIDFRSGDCSVNVVASRERVDVFNAGFTLFSGFDVVISSFSQKLLCKAWIEKKQYDIKPAFMNDGDLIRLDEIGKNHMSGWVNYPDGLKSLSFFSKFGVVRAETQIRRDVNEALGTASDLKYGFSVDAVSVSDFYAVNVNNKLIHWINPEWPRVFI